MGREEWRERVRELRTRRRRGLADPPSKMLRTAGEAAVKGRNRIPSSQFTPAAGAGTRGEEESTTWGWARRRGAAQGTKRRGRRRGQGGEGAPSHGLLGELVVAGATQAIEAYSYETVDLIRGLPESA